MPKVKISEYSSTANSNTDVASINIDEGCAPSGINNAIRAVMGHLKDFQVGTNGDPFNGPVNGTVGATTPATGAFTTLTTSSTVTHNGGTANGVAYLNGSKVLTTGSALVFDGTNLGLGVTPSNAWAGTTSLETQSCNLNSVSTSDVRFMQNVYYNAATSPIYKTTNAASMYRQASGAHQWFNAASGTAGNTISFTQAMTLDASGNLGVSKTSPTRDASTTSVAIGNGSKAASLDLYGTARNFAIYTGGDGQLGFFDLTAGSERARIDSSGRLLVGKTARNFASAGVDLQASGDSHFVSSSDTVAAFNRLTSDGVLVYFAQDSTLEGNISVSGSTVSYNGGHLARYTQLTTGAKDESLLKGTVLSNLDEMCVYVNTETGETAVNEQLNKTKVSDIEGDVNVAGVFVSWIRDEQHGVDEINMAMTGDMIIRIAQGTTVARGDLLMSAGDGTAKPQGDDIIRAKTIAKVTSTHVTYTYEDGSYCVPCVLMAC